TMGGSGVVLSAESLIDIDFTIQNACLGQNVIIETELTGSNDEDILYYDSNFNFLSEGSEYTISEIANEVTLFVTTCDGNHLKMIQVTPNAIPAFSIGEDMSICKGDSVTIQ